MSFAYTKRFLICLVYIWTKMDLVFGEMEYYPENQEHSEHYALQRLASLLEQAHRNHVNQKQLEKNQEIIENPDPPKSSPFQISSLYMNRLHHPKPHLTNEFENFRQYEKSPQYEENDEVIPISSKILNPQKIKPALDLREFEPFAEQLEEDNLEYVMDNDKPEAKNQQIPDINPIGALENRMLENLSPKVLNPYDKPKLLNKNYGRLYANHHFGNDLIAMHDSKYIDTKEKSVFDQKTSENVHNFEQKEAEEPDQHNHQHEKNNPKSGENEGPEFTYKLPQLGSNVGFHDKDPPFAVGPNDPRYYKDNHEQKVEIRADHHVQDQFVKKTLLAKRPLEDDGPTMYVVAMIAGISAAATVGLVAFGIGWYTLQKRSKLAQDTDYPAYGVTGPNLKDSNFGNQCGSLQSPGCLGSLSSADKRLAQSAQLYHYHHQKQQILAMENRLEPSQMGNQSDPESDEENDEGDYTVYECPGLAPTGEMEVKNPMFLDDPTPATPQNQNEKSPQHKN